jgi:hypothetical protein
VKRLDTERIDALNGRQVVHGMLAIKPTVKPDNGGVVSFIVDGQFKGVANQQPYEYVWDSRTSANGERVIEIKVSDASGRVVRVERRVVDVENR